MALDYRAYPVLCVDDEPSNLVTLRYGLEESFTIVTASSGAAALEILRSRRVAVILADQRMPEMTGVELCGRAREIQPHAVRMILTAYADIQAATDAINRGQVSRYLMKPWRKDELAEVLRTAIELVHIERTVREMEVRLLGSTRSQAGLTLRKDLVRKLMAPLRDASTKLRAAQDVLEAAAAETPPGKLRELIEKTARAQDEADQAVMEARSLLERADESDRGIAHSHRPTDVIRAVDSTVRVLRPELESVARLEVSFRASPYVRVDSTSLAQMVLNLLLNAAQAIPPGDPAGNFIVVEVGEEAGRAEIRVRDSGAGILPDVREHIFEPHYSTKEDGAGLGLCVVRDIAREAGGTIDLETKPGRGTTFCLALPSVER